MNVPDQAAVKDAVRLARERGTATAAVVRQQLPVIVAQRPEAAVAGAFVGGLILAKILRRLGT